MYDKTDQANRQVSQPPVTPVLLPFKGGRTLWQALFHDVQEPPRFIALFVRWNDQDHDWDIAPNEPRGYEQRANRAALGDATLQRAVLHPLLARLHDRYSEDTHLLILSNGKVFASDEHDAIDAVVHGTPPVDPDELRISVPAFLDRCWNAGRLFANNRNPRMKAIGLLVFIGSLILSLFFGSLWVFAVYMLGDAIASLATSLGAPFWLSLLASIAISAFEIVGVFIPALRPYALATSAVDMGLHLWYGYGIGVGRNDPELIQGIWSFLFGLLAIAPEFLFLLFIGIVYYTFPLLWRWLPKHLKRLAVEGRKAWKQDDDDYIDGEYVMDDVDAHGRRVARMLKG